MWVNYYILVYSFLFSHWSIIALLFGTYIEDIIESFKIYHDVITMNIETFIIVGVEDFIFCYIIISGYKSYILPLLICWFCSQMSMYLLPFKFAMTKRRYLLWNVKDTYDLLNLYRQSMWSQFCESLWFKNFSSLCTFIFLSIVYFCC